jgi:hypothetical protein
LAALALLSVCEPAQAQGSIQPGVPPGKWKWYYGVFASVGVFSAPDVFWGSATLEFRNSKIEAQMEEIPKASPPPVLTGKISAQNRIDAVLGGILLNEDPRPMYGSYRKYHWGLCTVETIVLQERDRPEDVLVFRRGTPGGC